jgi:ferredoxin
MDMVIARLMGIEPGEVPLLRRAMDQGLLQSDGTDITLLGEDLGDLIVADYRKPSTYRGAGKGMRKNAALSLVQRAGKVYSLRPSVARERCTGCGKCRLICPVQAVSLESKIARIDPGRCIRCYCCHEMCTDGAIVLKRGVAGGVLARLLGLTGNQG